ncbi:MAG: 4-(cytidine 5'-diphospho)-2-C-methyl-D-erythritol kinase [Deltaproteobacteria bacterium]|nr:4-(cytidine 5'-diphospho)-2-C-methyl-D-erythritol kinase [Deltaproteobacteria bacterium]
MGSDRLCIQAPAKINLVLRVLGRRTDGFHELRSLMAPIGLCDSLEVVRGENAGVRLRCPDRIDLENKDNLASRAALAHLEASGARFGVEIELEKRIPVQAGLGGGSSDAAAVLRALQRLSDQALPDDELASLALSLGADVPFFLQPGPCWARGVGERLAPVDLPPFWLVLASPRYGLSTRRVFESANFPLTSPRDDDRYDGPFLGLERIAALAANDLQATAESLHPDIARVCRALRGSGAACAAMSGSGPSVFGLFASEAAARRALASVKREQGWTYMEVKGINSAKRST